MSAQKKKIREAFRDAVFERDDHKCFFCNETSYLDAHHITDRSKMPNGGYVRENGITLCAKHHLAAEIFHVTDGKEWREGYHPDELYKLIGSSYDKAVEASKKLSR